MGEMVFRFLSEQWEGGEIKEGDGELGMEV